MKKMLIATSIASFSFGALISWAVVSDKAERRFKDAEKHYLGIIRHHSDQISNLHVEMRQLYGTTPERIHLLHPNEDAKEEDDASPVAEASEEDDEDIELDEPVEVTRSNLQRLINQYTINEDNNDHITKVVNQVNTERPPFVISREVYAYDDEHEDYDKITLTYYEQDRVLLDSDEELVDDVARDIGWRNLSRFGDESGDPDVVFIRNHRLETDFEIVREDENTLPLHIKYGMEKEEFRVNKAAGLLKLRQEDDDN